MRFIEKKVLKFVIYDLLIIKSHILDWNKTKIRSLVKRPETHNEKLVLFLAYLTKLSRILLDIAHILALPVNQPQKNFVSEEFTLSPLNIKRVRYFLLTANLDVT